MAFASYYAGKRVLVTGDTGFKGPWLVAWLKHLGAEVIGYAIDPPTMPSSFHACRIAQRITHVHGDVRDEQALLAACEKYRPQIVFHLAAQPLVRQSLRDPLSTYTTNVIGTLNVLEAVRRTASVETAVIITSDKCYLNVEWAYAYRENDRLGGVDPYSVSKACAELVVANYQDKRFQSAIHPTRTLGIASARAGNVFGGGDWASDRLIPDVVRAITSNRDIELRYPHAIRPWQHVLEALSGYLCLGALIHTQPELYCAAWNFGPADVLSLPVREMVERILARWEAPSVKVVVSDAADGGEARILRLDCTKTHHHLHWRSVLSIEQAIDATVTWYKRFYSDPGQDMYPFTIAQIDEYVDLAKSMRLPWACEREEARQGHR